MFPKALTIDKCRYLACMMRFLFCATLLLVFAWGCSSPKSSSSTFLPVHTVQDSVIYWSNFSSRYVSARNVEVWLPAGYHADTKQAYKVLVVHDGQNVFNPNTAFTGIDWGVDETLGALVATGKCAPTVVVAVWNSGNSRSAEYLPNVPGLIGVNEDATRRIRMVSQADSAWSDNYLRFLTQELLPQVQRSFHVSGSLDDTFIMGSSMGGLISLYAVTKYPLVFGGAACLSTHWAPTTTPSDVFLKYLDANMPSAVRHKFYFDYGDAGKDSTYRAEQVRVDSVFLRHGYFDGANYVSRYFPGADHNEAAWRARVDKPLLFLLRK